MASEKVLAFVENVKELTVLELAELVKALEEEFGVSAAAPVAVAAAPAAAGAAAGAAAVLWHHEPLPDLQGWKVLPVNQGIGSRSGDTQGAGQFRRCQHSGQFIQALAVYSHFGFSFRDSVSFTPMLFPSFFCEVI